MRPGAVMPSERDPTQDELLAMAYADGQLSGESLRAFEARLASESLLAREVSNYRALELLAREMAAPEPMDYEWDRLSVDPVHSLGNKVGWTLFVLGILGVFGFQFVELLGSELSLLPKLLWLAVLTGITTLILLTVRARLRTLPYDPYRKVNR